MLLKHKGSLFILVRLFVNLHENMQMKMNLQNLKSFKSFKVDHLYIMIDPGTYLSGSSFKVYDINLAIKTRRYPRPILQ